jgi:hypothetical protein
MTEDFEKATFLHNNHRTCDVLGTVYVRFIYGQEVSVLDQKM